MDDKKHHLALPTSLESLAMSEKAGTAMITAFEGFGMPE